MFYCKTVTASFLKSAINGGGGRKCSGKLDGVIRTCSVWGIASPQLSKTISLRERRSAPDMFTQWLRGYCYSCPPPGCCCPPPCPGSGRRICPPPCCNPGPIPPNPCCPRFYHGKNTYKKYKYFALFFCFPLILFQTFNALGNPPPHKGPCREHEYMRIRTKRFPWPGSDGTGQETFFHNPHVNHLPAECEPPPLICDD